VIATRCDPDAGPTSAPKRKQRSPFYTRIRKDKAKQAAGASKIWERVTIVRTETGTRRQREYYATLKEAKAAEKAAKALNIREGALALDLPPQLRAEAVTAAAILAGRGTLIEAAQYYVARALSGSTMKLSELVGRYLEFQRSEGAAPSYHGSISWRLRRFAEFFPKSKIANEVTLAEIDRYLAQRFVRQGRKGQAAPKKQTPRPLSPTGRKIETRNIRPMFHWAQDMKIIAASPFPANNFFGRKSKDAHHAAKPRVLTLEEAKRVLVHAGPLLPHIVVGLFAGLRPDETKNLDWADVNFTEKRIIVNNNDATGHARREVPLPDNAIVWLFPLRQANGPVSPAKLYRQRLERLAKAASLSPWPRDVLRHTFASFWLAKNGDEARLKTLMGHHWASNVLRAHYINDRISRADADVFWKLDREQIVFPPI